MNDITARFIDVYNYLLNSGKVSSQADFAKKIGISVSMMNEISKGRTNAGINPIQKTVIEYSEICSEWLLIGYGSMLKTKSIKNVTFLNGDINGDKNGDNPKVKKMSPNLSITSDVNEEYKKVMLKIKFADDVSLSDQGAPFYPLPVSAGKVAELVQEKELPTGFISIPGVSCKAYFPVIGFSYEPLIRAGDIIGVDFINRWDRLDTESLYYVLTKDNRMLKRLEEHPTDPEQLMCISPNYKEFSIWKSEIITIHKVIFYGRLV